MKDKEKIKQEIESYKESMKGLEPHSDFRRGQITAYNQIMQFIDSIPEEYNEDLMMKDAVDAIVHQGLYSKYVTECDNEALANVLKNYNSGDRVKIIIIKTE